MATADRGWNGHYIITVYIYIAPVVNIPTADHSVLNSVRGPPGAAVGFPGSCTTVGFGALSLFLMYLKQFY